MPDVLEATAVARESVDSFNDSAWDRFGAILADDSTYDEMATQRHAEGRDDILALNRGWKEAFPDATGTIERMIDAGDTVTMELTWRGHQTGPLATPSGAVPATGREIAVKAAQVLEIRGGKVVSDHHYFDMAGMLAQLGITG
jgi:steroid delta-isomerase-like uncharacterized protein